MVFLFTLYFVGMWIFETEIRYDVLTSYLFSVTKYKKKQ